MSRRLIVLILAFMPLSAWAADTLGPAPVTSSTGASSGDASILQPAGQAVSQSPLQSGAASQLQAPVTSDATHQMVLGEADGTVHTASEPTPNPAQDWFWFVLLFALITTGTIMVIRDRRRFASDPTKL